MRHSFTLLLAAVVVVVLAFYMFCFQVSYQDIAIVKTFGDATAEDVKREPGLYMKLPAPIQVVTRYPRRIQVLEDRIEQIQTADGFAVVAQVYLLWRISEEKAHEFLSLETVSRAQQQLRPLLQETQSRISQYAFDELVNPDPDKLKLSEIETEQRKALQERVDESGFGIEIVRVGIKRIVVPEQVTQKIFERMRENRQALAENARAEGEAEAARIRSVARAARDRIMAFANRRATEIRAEGERQAARTYRVFNENQDLAIFLAQIEAVNEYLANQTTVILSPADLGVPQELFRTRPVETDAAPASPPEFAPAASGEPVVAEPRAARDAASPEVEG